MTAVFTPRQTQITCERYQRMVPAGILTKNDRIELIEGEMIDTAPIGPKHAAVTARLTRLDFYANQIPEAGDVLLLIEVSDTTLSFDRGAKAALCARTAARSRQVTRTRCRSKAPTRSRQPRFPPSASGATR
jgi:hypothetical protein